MLPICELRTLILSVALKNRYGLGNETTRTVYIVWEWWVWQIVHSVCEWVLKQHWYGFRLRQYSHANVNRTVVWTLSMSSAQYWTIIYQIIVYGDFWSLYVCSSSWTWHLSVYCSPINTMHVCNVCILLNLNLNMNFSMIYFTKI